MTKTIGLLAVLTATLVMSASATAGTFRLVMCNAKQAAKTELRCAQKNIWHARGTLQWISAEQRRTLQVVPVDGNRLLKLTSMKRNMTWLLAESLRDKTEARARLTPPRPAVDSCTLTILSREGGWNPHATNPSSGAYGGPQALPGSKMASAGADWADNIWTQIKWMIGYETARYGSPCAALAAWDRQGWY